MVPLLDSMDFLENVVCEGQVRFKDSQIPDGGHQKS